MAYCREEAGLERLAGVVRASASLTLVEAASRLSRLGELAARGGLVVVARLDTVDEELADVTGRSEGVPVVVLTSDARRVALKALQAGAGAVIDAEAGGRTIDAAVMSVTQGLVAFPAESRPFERPGALAVTPEPLTPREIEILSLLAGGDSNKTIAARLSISVHTVKFHISSILSKLGVGSRTEAVALGLRLGIVLL